MKSTACCRGALIGLCCAAALAASPVRLTDRSERRLAVPPRRRGSGRAGTMVRSTGCVPGLNRGPRLLAGAGIRRAVRHSAAPIRGNGVVPEVGFDPGVLEGEAGHAADRGRAAHRGVVRQRRARRPARRDERTIRVRCQRGNTCGRRELDRAAGLQSGKYAQRVSR